jgi:hypothetical protein
MNIKLVALALLAGTGIAIAQTVAPTPPAPLARPAAPAQPRKRQTVSATAPPGKNATSITKLLSDLDQPTCQYLKPQK